MDNPISRLIEPIARWAAILCGWAVLIYSFAVAYEILGRKLFGFSFQGIDDIGGYVPFDGISADPRRVTRLQRLGHTHGALHGGHVRRVVDRGDKARLLHMGHPELAAAAVRVFVDRDGAGRGDRQRARLRFADGRFPRLCAKSCAGTDEADESDQATERGQKIAA